MMTGDSLSVCLNHLRQAERLLEEVDDLASLARLALVIDMLRFEHDLPERDLYYQLP